MMHRSIQKLPQDVIGKIAAGEVVERPAAAVKELVENAIDAEASAITVELMDGGITSIRVSDNGVGIPAGQLRMAFERHATSKLISADELFHVHTLGFRGEALASVAAVSKVTCTSKTVDAEYGMKAQVEAGQFVDFLEAASPVGTTITVKDLFFNAPVRLKFLKKPSTEAALVSDYLMRLILSRPDIAFRFASQGKTIYRSTGDWKLETAIYAVYGKEAAQTMHKVSGSESGVLIDGYVGVQELSRGNRQQQSFFINGRYFRNEFLSRALESATEGFVMIGRFPICALNITMAYEQVDVNVHPNKLEVRFQNSAAVMQAVETVVREALQAQTIARKLTEPAQSAEPVIPPISVALLQTESRDSAQSTIPVSLPQPLIQPQTETFRRPSLHETIPVAFEDADVSFDEPPVVIPIQQDSVQETFSGISDAPVIRYIGAAFQTYLIFEADDRLLLVDQHAAHERVLYDRYMARYQGEHVSQQLITPILIDFTAKDVDSLLGRKAELEALGFTLDAFDATSIAVRATPVILGESEPVRELLVDIVDDLRLKAASVTLDRLKQRIAQMACKHAIKGGDRLSTEDVEELIRQMLVDDVQPTCPHGRPIVQEMTRRDLEKRFRRIQ